MYAFSMSAPLPMMAGPRTVLCTIRAPDSTTTFPRISLVLHVPVVARHQAVEDDPVRLQHVLEAARVLPPTLDDVWPHHESMVDQPLDRVGDLELAARRRPDGLHRLEDRRVEHVHADQRQVGRRRLRLLHEPNDLAVRRSSATPNWLGFGTAASRIWLLGFSSRKRVTSGAEPLANQVVAEVHAERLRAEERLPRRARRAPVRAEPPARCT